MRMNLLQKTIFLATLTISLSSCLFSCRNTGNLLNYKNLDSNSIFSGVVYCNADSGNKTGLIVLDSDNLDLRAITYKYNGHNFHVKERVEFSIYYRGDEYIAKNVDHFNPNKSYQRLGFNDNLIEIHNRSNHNSANAHKRWHYQEKVNAVNLNSRNYNIVKFKEELSTRTITVAIPTSIDQSTYNRGSKLFLNFTANTVIYNNEEIRIVDKLDEKHANLH